MSTRGSIAHCHIRSAGNTESIHTYQELVDDTIHIEIESRGIRINVTVSREAWSAFAASVVESEKRRKP